LSVEAFSGAFETAWNFEIDKVQFAPPERAALAALFDVVVWYSPFESERISIGYVGDEQVLAAVQTARGVIGV
jgi:hypothetical protein